MSTSLTTQLSRLADHLGDLRVRLQEAARHEVGDAIADALAEATRMLIAGRRRRPNSTYDQHSQWDDPWDEAGGDTKSWADEDLPNEVQSAPESGCKYQAALMSGLAVARWSLGRTGHPAAALALAAAVTLVVLIAGGRFKSFVEIITVAQELLDYPKRPI